LDKFVVLTLNCINLVQLNCLKICAYVFCSNGFPSIISRVILVLLIALWTISDSCFEWYLFFLEIILEFIFYPHMHAMLDYVPAPECYKTHDKYLVSKNGWRRKITFQKLSLINQVVSDNKKNDGKHFRLKNYAYKYIHGFKFGSSHEIEEIVFWTTRWFWVLVFFKCIKQKCIQIMHFWFDEQFLKVTKILEIENNENFRGSVPTFRWPKWYFPKIFVVPVF
jgi:hypothetical protein